MKKGFTLAETLLTCALLAILLGLTQLNVHGGAGTASQTQALAQVLVAQLQRCRLQAIKDQAPVAMVFPSDGGSLPHSQSFSVMSGRPKGQIRRSFRWQGDYPRAYAVWGIWRAEQVLNPPASSTFSAENWLPTDTHDYAVIFTPDGRVSSNDLPWVDDQLQWLVCSGYRSTPGGPPAGPTRTTTCQPGYFQISGAENEWTVHLSSQGQTWATLGASGASLPRVGAGNSPGATALAVNHNNQPPLLESVEVLPQRSMSGDTAFNTTVGPESWVSLLVVASDPDGDALRCDWSCNNGTLTTASPGTPLAWDPIRQKWTGTWIWHCPPGATHGQSFQLDCHIWDDHGHPAAANGFSHVDFLYQQSGRFIFAATEPGSLHDLYICRADGTATRSLTQSPNNSEYDPCVSPDGKTLIYSDNSAGRRLHSLDLASLHDRDLGINGFDACFAPDGSRFVFNVGVDDQLHVAQADGTGDTQIAVNASGPSWSPLQDGPIVFQRGGNLWSIQPDGSGETQITSLNTASSEISFTPDGNRIVFGLTGGGIASVALDGSGYILKRVGEGTLYSPPSWSPDRSQVVFTQANRMWVMDDPGPNLAFTNARRVDPMTPFVPASSTRCFWIP